MTGKPWRRIPPTLFGVAGLLMTVALGGWLIRDDLQLLGALEDPARAGAATATVTDSQSGLHTWTTWITFTTADGRQIITTDWPGSSRYRTGHRYPVRYELADPTRATLEPVRRRLLVDLVLPVGLTPVCLGWLVVLGRSWLRTRHLPPPPPKPPRTRPTPRPRRTGPPKHLA